MKTLTVIPLRSKSTALYQRRLQGILSRKLVQLHERGYIFDFRFAGENGVICLQEDTIFLMENITLKEVCQAYDTLSHSDKLIFTVETYCGYRAC